MKKINLLVLFLFLFGCVKEQPNDSDLMVVDLTIDYPSTKEMFLQDFMNVEYIPLETNDEFITHGVVRAIGDEFILVTNKNRLRDGNILIFDRKGKAIRKVNRMGQGNGEYSNIMEIVLDEDDDEMYVHNHYERKIQVYDLQGNFKRSLKYKENTNGAFYTDIINFDKHNLICYDAYGKEKEFVLISKNDAAITCKLDIPLEGVKQLVQVDKTGKRYALPDPYPRVMPYEGCFLLLEQSSDTIYKFSSSRNLSPFCVRRPSIYSVDPEEFLLLRMLSDRYIFMETMKSVYDFEKEQGFPKSFLMYDKKKKLFLNIKFITKIILVKKKYM